MKVGLIGANGSVGTELCFLLNHDIDLKPIIRNRLGAVFLKHHGFDCHIADISQESDAKESLSDVDFVNLKLSNNPVCLSLIVQNCNVFNNFFGKT